MNDVTYVEAARSLAELMITQGGSTPDDRIAFAFRRAVAHGPDRRPSGDVLNRGLEGYLAKFQEDREGRPDNTFSRATSRRPPGIDPVELAAYTAIASVILNLDETITIE